MAASLPHSKFSPKHILMTTDTLGGVWTYSVELCRALSAKGVRVTLAAMGAAMGTGMGGGAGAERARALRDLPNVELYEKPFRLEWMDDPWNDVDAAGTWLLSLARNLNPDVIHLNGYAHAALDWGVPRVVVAHSCVYSWWSAVKNEQAPERYAEYRRRVCAGLRSADVVISPSAAMRAVLERWYSNGRATDGSRKEGLVIPNARSGAAFPRGEKLDLIFSSGRLWDEGKNIRALVKVAKKLAWPIYIAGDTAGPNSRIETGAGVAWLGQLTEAQIAPWYSRAAIYAHPAKYEPFGLAVLEAALAGCALVLSDIPSLRENWDGAALFADPGSPKALQHAIQCLIEDSGLRKTLQYRAAARARRFSPGMMGRRYLEAYALAAQNFQKNYGPPLRRAS